MTYDRARWERHAREGLGWPARAARVAPLLATARSVCDLGAAGQVLRAFLPPGCAYYPVDGVGVLGGTAVVDLDEPFDALPQAEVYVALGLLDYLRDHARFVADLKRCAPSGARWIWSYMLGRHGGLGPVLPTEEDVRAHFARLTVVREAFGAPDGHALFGGPL